MNYQLELDHILESISKLDKKPTLLLHACCGPCSSYVLEYLSNYFDITILYYNPNIYPDKEFYRRKEELKKFLTEFKLADTVKLIEDNYDPNEYYEAITGKEELGERSKRCYSCYELRLERTVKYAKEHNFDYFTTTLSISPYKVSDWINTIGGSLEKLYAVKYLYSDFKKKNGYKRSLELSSQYGLYRQDYCGCKYSKEARDGKNKKSVELYQYSVKK